MEENYNFKRPNIAKIAIVILLLLFNTIAVFAQLHSEPECGENFTLDWSASPSASNEYNWSSPGALSSTYTNVDDSGIDISVTFTGDTHTLGVWSSQTPKVGNNSSYLYEGLDLITNGFSNNGITCTINFSSPIYALSFDLHHVNQSGLSGDQYIISATTTNGNTVYPTFTSSAYPSYTVNNTNGTVDANQPSTYGNDAVVGVNFTDSEYITSVTFLWRNCSTCAQYYIHGSGLGNFSFCIPQTLDFDGVNDYISRSSFLGGQTEATMMAWVKLDNSFDGGEIMGQRNFRIFLESNGKLRAYARTDSGGSSTYVTPTGQAPVLQNNLWYHVAAIYDGASGSLDLLLNGEIVWNYFKFFRKYAL